MYISDGQRKDLQLQAFFRQRSEKRESRKGLFPFWHQKKIEILLTLNSLLGTYLTTEEISNKKWSSKEASSYTSTMYMYITNMVSSVKVVFRFIMHSQWNTCD